MSNQKVPLVASFFDTFWVNTYFKILKKGQLCLDLFSLDDFFIDISFMLVISQLENQNKKIAYLAF